MNIPAERVRVLLEPIVAQSSINHLCSIHGLNHHTIGDIMGGKREYVSDVFVDNLAAKLGRPDWLHVELADLWDEKPEPEGTDRELDAALRRAERAEKRATKWYGEVKRLRGARRAWENKYWRLRAETEQWRQAERYARRQKAAA